MADDQLAELLADQVAYYCDVVDEYFDHGLDLAGGSELESALRPLLIEEPGDPTLQQPCRHV
jgi:hypothetical protein